MTGETERCIEDLVTKCDNYQEDHKKYMSSEFWATGKNDYLTKEYQRVAETDKKLKNSFDCLGSTLDNGFERIEKSVDNYCEKVKSLGNVVKFSTEAITITYILACLTICGTMFYPNPKVDNKLKQTDDKTEISQTNSMITNLNQTNKDSYLFK